jgi:hypothetical protein
MSENIHPQPNKSEDNEINFDYTSSLIGTRAMNIMIGFPLLVIMTGFMFYAAIDQKQLWYLLPGVVMLPVLAVAAKFLFAVPTAQPVQRDDHQQFVSPDKGDEN